MQTPRSHPLALAFCYSLHCSSDRYFTLQSPSVIPLPSTPVVLLGFFRTLSEVEREADQSSLLPPPVSVADLQLTCRCVELARPTLNCGVVTLKVLASPTNALHCISPRQALRRDDGGSLVCAVGTVFVCVEQTPCKPRSRFSTGHSAFKNVNND